MGSGSSMARSERSATVSEYAGITETICPQCEAPCWFDEEPYTPGNGRYLDKHAEGFFVWHVCTKELVEAGNAS